MHLKNVDPAVRARVLAGELGIAGVLRRGGRCARCPTAPSTSPPSCAGSRASGFAGPVVVEQDLNETASETPAELARRNLDFLAGL